MGRFQQHHATRFTGFLAASAASAAPALSPLTAVARQLSSAAAAAGTDAPARPSAEDFHAASAPQPPPPSSSASASSTSAETTWARTGLPTFMLGKLGLMNVKAPTRVQSEALSFLCKHLEAPPQDCVIHSETGSGKTLAYLLPIFARIEPKVAPHAKLRAIIVTPTRELSHQVTEVATRLGEVGKHKDPSKVVRVQRAVGEVSGQLLHDLKYNPPHILVGTPRTLATLVPAHVNLGQLQCVVLDEADELVRNHSIDAVKAIVKGTHRLKSMPGLVAVSATSSFGLQKFNAEHMRRSHKVIDMLDGHVGTPDSLSHLCIRVPTPAAAYNTFTRVLAALRPTAVLSFHNSAKTMEAMEVHLKSKNQRVRVIGAAYANAQRARALDSITTGQAQILLSTEMAARGLDLPRLSHVVNFDPAKSLREYVHRVGRVARLSSTTPGRRGTALTFVLDDAEQDALIDMCSELGVSLSELTMKEGEPQVSQLLGPVADLAAWRRNAKVRAKAKDKRVAAAAVASGEGGSPLLSGGAGAGVVGTQPGLVRPSAADMAAVAVAATGVGSSAAAEMR